LAYVYFPIYDSINCVQCTAVGTLTNENLGLRYRKLIFVIRVKQVVQSFFSFLRMGVVRTINRPINRSTFCSNNVRTIL
jgi:hypothetical protein